MHFVNKITNILLFYTSLYVTRMKYKKYQANYDTANLRPYRSANLMSGNFFMFPFLKINHYKFIT